MLLCFQLVAIKIYNENAVKLKGENLLNPISVKEICYEVFGDSKYVI